MSHARSWATALAIAAICTAAASADERRGFIWRSLRIPPLAPPFEGGGLKASVVIQSNECLSVAASNSRTLSNA